MSLRKLAMWRISLAMTHRRLDILQHLSVHDRSCDPRDKERARFSSRAVYPEREPFVLLRRESVSAGAKIDHIAPRERRVVVV